MQKLFKLMTWCTKDKKYVTWDTCTECKYKGYVALSEYKLWCLQYPMRKEEGTLDDE